MITYGSRTHSPCHWRPSLVASFRKSVFEANTHHIIGTAVYSVWPYFIHVQMQLGGHPPMCNLGARRLGYRFDMLWFVVFLSYLSICSCLYVAGKVLRLFFSMTSVWALFHRTCFGSLSPLHFNGGPVYSFPSTHRVSSRMSYLYTLTSFRKENFEAPASPGFNTTYNLFSCRNKIKAIYVWMSLYTSLTMRCPLTKVYLFKCKSLEVK